MTEQDYISGLQAGWPRQRGDEVSPATMALADEAVRVFPQSPRLWVMRGNLIELGPESMPYSLQDALASYKRAIEIEPKFAEAWEEIGHFYDAVLADEKSAQKFFQEAERSKGKHVA